MKRNLKTVLVLICLGIIFLVTCKHNPNDIPTPINPSGNGNGNGNGNTKDSVCFAEEILPLLISNCAKAGCHDAASHQGGVNLTSYGNVMSTISGSDLVNSITGNGQDIMPPANSPPPLSGAQISLIQTWVNQGMQNGIDCQCNIDTNNVTFNGVIFPIFQTNCLGCHNTTLPILTNYSFIKYQLDTGRLFNAMNHIGGVVPMPLNGPKLSVCRLTAFNKWVNAGAPNN